MFRCLKLTGLKQRRLEKITGAHGSATLETSGGLGEDYFDFSAACARSAVRIWIIICYLDKKNNTANVSYKKSDFFAIFLWWEKLSKILEPVLESGRKCSLIKQRELITVLSI
jgi:hypothetical protein